MTLAVGSRLGPYDILSPPGAGGFGEVYKARDTRLDRTVAIEVLPAAVASDPIFRERFDRAAHDGKRFLLNDPLEENAQAPISVIMNWPAVLNP